MFCPTVWFFVWLVVRGRFLHIVLWYVVCHRILSVVRVGFAVSGVPSSGVSFSAHVPAFAVGLVFPVLLCFLFFVSLVCYSDVFVFSFRLVGLVFVKKIIYHEVDIAERAACALVWALGLCLR